MTFLVNQKVRLLYCREHVVSCTSIANECCAADSAHPRGDENTLVRPRLSPAALRRIAGSVYCHQAQQHGGGRI